MLKTDKEKIRQIIVESFHRFLLDDILSNREKPVENNQEFCYNITNCGKPLVERGK